MEFWGKNRPKTVFSPHFGQIFDFSRKSPKFVNRTTSLSGVQIFREIQILLQKNVKMTFFGRSKSHFEYAAAPRAIRHIARPCMLCVRNAYAVAAGSARPVWPGGVHFARTGTTNSTTQNK